MDGENSPRDEIFTGDVPKLCTVEGTGIPLEFYPPLSSIKVHHLAQRHSNPLTALQPTLLEPSRMLINLFAQIHVSGTKPHFTRITMPRLVEWLPSVNHRICFQLWG